MTAEDLHKNLLAAGFTLKADGDTLRVSPASRVGQGLQRLIRQHKADLLFLASLPEPPALAPEELESIEEAVAERSAIRQHDGGEDRQIAETRAASAMKVYRLLIAMGEGEEARWITMLAPNTALDEAEHTARLKFGTRLLRIIPNTPPQGPETVSGVSAPTSTSPASAQSPSDGLLVPAITTEK